MPSESPSGPPGSVKVVDFVLFGQSFTAMSAGPLDPFNHAVSFVVNCDDQAEIDKYWNALLGNGGTAEQCGWLRDRYGLSWQIVPKMLAEMMSEPDRAKAKRVTDAMLKMVKIDIAALKAAAQAALSRRSARPPALPSGPPMLGAGQVRVPDGAGADARRPPARCDQRRHARRDTKAPPTSCAVTIASPSSSVESTAPKIGIRCTYWPARSGPITATP